MMKSASCWRAILFLTALSTAPIWGGGRLLSYHEAIVVTSAMEMSERNDWLTPTIHQTLWLEKPPLPQWLIMVVHGLTRSFAEPIVRIPAFLSAFAIAFGVAVIARNHYGATTGWLAGGVQATMLWTVNRGRLMEADIVLAALIVWVMVFFDRIQQTRDQSISRWVPWGFFTLLGATSLAKGIGFGAVLALAAITANLVWSRDWVTAKRILLHPGWLWAAAIALIWPIAVACKHPQALELWWSHMGGRLGAESQPFVRKSLLSCLYELIPQITPWLPATFVGLVVSWKHAWSGKNQGDRLVWAWALAPTLLLSMATIKNPHYFLYVLPPWSIWAAQSLMISGRWLVRKGWTVKSLTQLAWAGLIFVALVEAIIFDRIAPYYDNRGQEWAFYRDSTSRWLEPGEPVVLVYSDSDREPYPTPFGDVPHDLAVRLYYLGRPVQNISINHLENLPQTCALICRPRDLSTIEKVRTVKQLAQNQNPRLDRSFVLARCSVK